MKKINHIKLFTLIFACCISSASAEVSQDNSSFAKLYFGDNLYIEVPKNWNYLNEEIRKQINTSTEATVRLARIDASQGNNVVLISATHSLFPETLLLRCI